MPVLPRARLLVADDAPEWRSIIAGLLEADCELVGTAERGDQVMQAARQSSPDVITLDVSMPGQSGLKALPGLRAAFPAVVIVIVSITADDLYRQEAHARGADDYIDKSTAGSDLRNAIASARDRRQLPN